MAKFCTGCGAAVSEEKKFCTECGMPVETEQSMQESRMQQETHSGGQGAPIQQETHSGGQGAPIQQAVPPPVSPRPAAYPMQPAAPPPMYGSDIPPAKGSKYDPVTTGGYIGIMLLMCIPIVGIVLVIIWACGGCKKINKRNLARASLIMMAVGLVLSLILGFAVKSLVGSAVSAIEEETGLSGLSGLVGGISGSSQTGESSRSDLEELGELDALLGALGGLSGEEGGSNGLGDLIDDVEAINREAEAANNGWPESLRAYPGGTATEVASYRTRISGTTEEEMLSYIEALKGDGYYYEDFYDFGMSEEDMLGVGGWWATNGEIYLSLSFSEGVLTVDHTYELPDLEGYFGE